MNLSSSSGFARTLQSGVDDPLRPSGPIRCPAARQPSRSRHGLAPMTLEGFVFILGILGSFMALVGVPVAIWRVLRTEATIKQTEAHLGHYQILTLMPQLVRIEALIDTSVQRDDREEAIRSLVDWKTAANRLRGFMDTTNPDQDFDRLLRKSISQVSATKRALIRTPAPPLAGATEAVRASIGSVTDYSGGLEARLLATAKRTPEGSK